MLKQKAIAALAFTALTLTACGEAPSPLDGRWVVLNSNPFNELFPIGVIAIDASGDDATVTTALGCNLVSRDFSVRENKIVDASEPERTTNECPWEPYHLEARTTNVVETVMVGDALLTHVDDNTFTIQNPSNKRFTFTRCSAFDTSDPWIIKICKA